MEVENKIKVRLAGTIRIALQKLEVKTRHKKLSDPWQHMCTQIPVRNGIKSPFIKDGSTIIMNKYKYLDSSFSQLHQSPNQIWQKIGGLTKVVKILYGSLVEIQYPIFSSNPVQYLLTKMHDLVNPVDTEQDQKSLRGNKKYKKCEYVWRK